MIAFEHSVAAAAVVRSPGGLGFCHGCGGMGLRNSLGFGIGCVGGGGG